VSTKNSTEPIVRLAQNAEGQGQLRDDGHDRAGLIFALSIFTLLPKSGSAEEEL
jgi:hypothetical protein